MAKLIVLFCQIGVLVWAAPGGEVQLEGTLAVAGLSKPVEVLRDRWGVPHIYAQSTADLFFAQGFVAAQDRLYQIEMWRRAGAGELAEVLGPKYVERDRCARLVRYRGDLEAEWRSYAPDTRAIAEAFAAGVNAYVRHCGDRLPVEFGRLGFRPGEWKAEHILLRISGLLMVRNHSQEAARAENVARFGLASVLKYQPPDPPAALELDPELPLDGIGPQMLAALRQAISAPAAREGSNNWVVSGKLSASGKPMLANDPHRPLLLPSLRYVTHLVAPGWNVIGSGEPAIPGVATGHNERIAWGITIDNFDQADLYVEQTDPRNPNGYLYKGQWLYMRLEREQVRVKGGAPVQVELKFTRHGPVIFEDRARNRAVALRWAGSEPGTAAYLGGLSLDRARNWTDFLDAMGRCKIPALNYVYADVDGNIGWVASGLIPVRKNWTGMLPVAGHAGRYEWDGFLPVSELPQKYNPAPGYIATANHNMLPAGYPHRVAFEFAAPYRFRRIDEVLGAGKKFTIADFERLQHDETSLPARELIAMLPADPLKKWDAVLGKDSADAALFEVWLPELTKKFAATGPAARLATLPRLIELLRAMPADARTRLLTDSLAAARARAPKQLRWGAMHKTMFRHPLAPEFDLGPVERGGDGNTPNATAASGASYRHIFDLADWDRAVFTNVPGQSGQPGTPHYADLLPLWAAGRYAPLPFTRGAVEQQTRHKLALKPAAASGPRR